MFIGSWRVCPVVVEISVGHGSLVTIKPLAVAVGLVIRVIRPRACCACCPALRGARAFRVLIRRDFHKRSLLWLACRVKVQLNKPRVQFLITSTRTGEDSTMLKLWSDVCLKNIAIALVSGTPFVIGTQILIRTSN